MTSNNAKEDISKLLELWYQQRMALTDAKISQFSTPISGVVNETYVHSVNFSKNNSTITQDAVLRMQPATSETPIPNVDVLEQAFVLRQLEQFEELLTPKVLAVESDPSFLGRPFYLMEKMAGEAIFDEETVTSDPKRLRYLYEQAIAMLARIHAIDWQNTELKSLYFATQTKSSLQVQLEQYRAHLDEASTEKSYPMFEQAYDYLINNIPEQSEAVLNWGDARVGNLLYDGDQLSAVLDWEIAAIAAREVDVGWFIYFERFLRNNAAKERLGAPSDDEIVALYQQYSGVKLSNLDYYQRWAAFRLSVMRLRAGLFDIKNGIEEPDSKVEEVNFATIEMARLFGYPEPN
ncbi:phosphotransferase family protein [Parahaliea sp. F7430]|uniref:Phosphotransferase family protein n=1 Tax=Sediminihaliea albiluteola TaxID=2758564 RepID=A0A7W2YKW1_9GAMM|nr:phosphotransferase family protein [Sediminihaliea albiluteola]MBA6413778.1 phosphotransferase family protein [Sediminihaliea albiluteola]